jgi:hypothetical protein
MHVSVRRRCPLLGRSFQFLAQLMLLTRRTAAFIPDAFVFRLSPPTASRLH